MIYDVVIAGAGPVGLFVASELGLRGLSVFVLEKMEDPHSPLKTGWMGMRGLNFPSVEAFYRRGLLKEIQHTSLAWMRPADRPGFDMSVKTAGSAPPPRFAGHFAGIMLDANKIDFSSDKYLLDGPASGGGLVTLEGVEEVLAEYALKLGITIRRDTPVTALTSSEDGVTIEAGGETFHSRWLVGCDGGRSTVRKLAGFEFEGTDPEFTGYSAWVDIADPEKLQPTSHRTACTSMAPVRVASDWSTSTMPYMTDRRRLPSKTCRPCCVEFPAPMSP